MTVMTLNLVEKQPAAMRRIIGKHLAVPRWQDTCDYYNQMTEQEVAALELPDLVALAGKVVGFLSPNSVQ
ncbi:TPA: hypothetical protein IBW16_000245 [Escherichia coli]|nr:hypothetical protein [Escherichia coli]